MMLFKVIQGTMVGTEILAEDKRAAALKLKAYRELFESSPEEHDLDIGVPVVEAE